MDTTTAPAPKFWTMTCKHGQGHSHGGVGRMMRCTGPHGATLETPDGVIRFSADLVVRIYPPKKWASRQS